MRTKSTAASGFAAPLPVAVAADDRKDFPRDVTRALCGGQEHVRRCNLFGLRGAPDGGLRSELSHIGCLLVRRIKRSPYRARGHRIHSDATRQYLGRERSGEGVESALGGRVVNQILVSLKACDGTGVNDGTAGREAEPVPL
jgi:hypothetical protein